DASLFATLLSCGADPNTVLPSRCDKDFLAMFPSKGFSSYVEADKGLTVLMLAAGLGREDYLRALLAAGASRNQLTKRDKMSALDIAAETGHWRSSQILLGGGPSPDQLRVEISLALQRVALVKNGVPVYRTQCSTGRQGYATRRGDFVITNKERNHRSTLYHVEMPYFMRLSCLDFGMHAGIVPNYPASHGCIRLPEEAARKFFSEIPVGTLVTVQYGVDSVTAVYDRRWFARHPCSYSRPEQAPLRPIHGCKIGNVDCLRSVMLKLSITHTCARAGNDRIHCQSLSRRIGRR